MKKIVKETLDKYLKDGDKVIVGVSGGADSICLFYLLVEYCKSRQIEMVVVHVNHNLRGEEAKRDATYVEMICKKESVKYCLASVDVGGKVKQGYSLEEAARILRQASLEEKRKTLGARYILLAHNRDDLCETFIFNLCRGTGIAGLGSIRELRGKIIRPLLNVSRREILEYLQEHKLGYQIDSTNLSLDYTRNIIRREVLPYLKTNINEGVKEHISNAVYFIQELEEELEVLIKANERLILKKNDGYEIHLRHQNLSRFMTTQLIRKTLEKTVGLKDISKKNIDEIYSLLECKRPTFIDIKRGVVAGATELGIYLGKKPKKPCFALKNIPVGEALIVDNREFTVYRNCEEPKNRFINILKYDRLEPRFMVRKRCDGDYLLKSGKRIKLKDFLIKKKVDPFKRDELIVVSIGSRIIWLEAYFVDGNYLAKYEDEYVLTIG